MNGRRNSRRRTRLFLACEGKSEMSYGFFLQRLADDGGLRIHIVMVELEATGNPFVLAQHAVSDFERQEALDEKNKKNRGNRLVGKAILLDTDRAEEHPEEGRRARELLKREGFTAIWQSPDHEGFLLRHFPGCENKKPPRGTSMTALKREWPEYRKGQMTPADFMKKLSLEHVRRAAGVTPGLQEFLEAAGLL